MAETTLGESLLIIVIGFAILVALQSCEPNDRECARDCADRGATSWHRDPQYGSCVCNFPTPERTRP